MTRRKKEVIPLVPKKTVFCAQNGLPVTHILLNARHQLDIGDVYYRVEKHVIKRIIVTEGSSTLEVESEVTRSNWQKYLP